MASVMWSQLIRNDGKQNVGRGWEVERIRSTEFIELLGDVAKRAIL